jgi:uncharacterized protein (DUF736 family)
MSEKYDNTNRGVLFRQEKEQDNHPDYTGKINVQGKDFLLAAWIKTSKKGTKFMSLSVKPDTQGKAADSGIKRNNDPEADIPF